MSDANMLRLTAHKGIKTIQEKDNHQTSKVNLHIYFSFIFHIYFKISTPSTPQTKQNLIPFQIWTKKKSKKIKKNQKKSKKSKKNQKT